MSQFKLTSAQKFLINEIDLNKLTKKYRINKSYPMKEFPQRSGNLETPAKNPRHRKFLGQDPDGKGTMADKPGRPSSEDSVHAEPTSISPPEGFEEIGDAFEVPQTNSIENEDPFSVLKWKPTRLQGPAENPGAQTYTGFGNRYPR